MSAITAHSTRDRSKSRLTPYQIRCAIEDRIERLIGILDTMDGDADEEDTDPREDDAGDARELDDDREPALGWTETERQTFGPARFGDLSAYDEDEEFSLEEKDH